MEFINNNNEVLFINKTCTYIIINNMTYPVTNIGVFTLDNGKFETNEFIIKYSKNELYLYNKENIVLNTYKFSKFIETEINSDLLLNTFILKNNYYIKLYSDSAKKYYVLNNNIKEKILNIEELGDAIVYTTEFNNKLLISKLRHSKWNGNPVGRI